jgi:tetratricopeptide (TPR) repeat protein
LRKEALGERHPYIAQSISNISALYYAQGIYEKAEPLLKQAILLMKDLLGELHPDVAGSLFNLAVLYHHMQRHSEAMTSTQNAIQIYVQTIGIDHPRTKAAMSWLLSIRIALNNDLDL